MKNFHKFFLEMTPLGVKTCGESEFDICEAKKRFPDSEKACVLKRKVAKNAIGAKKSIPMIVYIPLKYMLLLSIGNLESIEAPNLTLI